MNISISRASRATVLLTLTTAISALAMPAFAGNCAKKTSDSANAYGTSSTMMTPVSITAQDGALIVYANHHASAKSNTIVDAAVATADLSTLVAAVTAADLVGTLSGPGPFTVFAPLNSAFDALPDGTVAGLLEPENKEALQKVLTAHVVAGNLSAADIISAAKKGGGTVDVKTVSGDTLTAILAGDNLYVKDEKGGLAAVKIADLMQSNGTVHVVDRVLLPL